MNEFEMVDYIDGTREMVFMAMHEHGCMMSDGHWLTAEKVNAMSEVEIVDLFKKIYGRD